MSIATVHYEHLLIEKYAVDVVVYLEKRVAWIRQLSVRLSRPSTPPRRLHLKLLGVTLRGRVIGGEAVLSQAEARGRPGLMKLRLTKIVKSFIKRLELPPIAQLSALVRCL